MTQEADTDADPRLKGLRILVVEDEMAIAMLIEDMLLELGCEVVGPAGRVKAALDLARSEPLDLAILDVNVAGEPVEPVARVLSERSIPIIFSTGYGVSGLAEGFRDRPLLQKPFGQHDLLGKLRLALPPAPDVLT